MHGDTTENVQTILKTCEIWYKYTEIKIQQNRYQEIKNIYTPNNKNSICWNLSIIHLIQIPLPTFFSNKNYKLGKLSKFLTNISKDVWKPYSMATAPNANILCSSAVPHHCQVWYLRDNCFDHNILARELLDLCLLKASFH